MFNRFEAIKKCIEDKSLEKDTLMLMIDFHMLKGTLTEAEGKELLEMLNPKVVESVVEE